MRIRAKKVSTLFLSLMLLISGFSGFFTGNEVFGGTGVDRVKTKITRFEIKDHNGGTIPPGQPLGYWNKFRLDMDWDASMYGAELKENDYFTITLPKQFIFPKDGPYVNFPLYVPGTNTVIANAHVDSKGEAGGGTVKVTFTKYVEGKDNIRGNLFLEATFAHHNINAGGQNTIVVSIGGVSTQVDINIGPKPTLNDEVFTKWGEKVNGNENQAQWVLRINHKKGDFSNVVIRDELFVSSGNLPPGIHYLPESFELKEVEMDAYGCVTKVVKTYTYNDLKKYLTFSNGKTKFEFEFSKLLGNTKGKQFRMGYKSTYIPQLMLKNKSYFQSKGNNYESDSYWVNSQAGGSGQGDLIQKIKIIKIDEENNEIRLPNAEFKITNVADGSHFTLTTNAQGEAVSNKLKPGKYKIKETKAPVGYVLDPTEHEVTVVAGEALFWTGKNKRSKVNIPVTKIWKDGDNQDGKRPDSIKIQLLADGQEVAGKTLTLTKDNNWTDSFKNLDEYKGDKKINYTIKEVKVENGYTSVTTGSAENGFKVTNTREPEKTKVEGEKTWDDANDQDGKRPNEITVNLLANGKKVKEAKVTKDTNWKYSFTDLDKYKDGQEITYTVTENEVKDYTTKIEGYKITNSYTPGKTSVTVTKSWEDADNQDGKRPSSIKVQLYGNDKKVGEEVTLNEGNSWTHTWAKLPKNAAGIPIKYTVKEVGEVDNYTTSYGEDSQGNIIITNKHVPEKTKVEGQKTWSDNDNQDGKRPESITVNLLADGRKVKEVKATAATDWKYSFTDLPKYENGRVIKYTVTENTVDDYNTEIEGYDIKNSYTPEETSVTVTKRWNDSNDKDRIRPERIKVQLYANGEKKGEAVELKAGSNWSYTWNRLPKKAKGKDIKYTVKEEGSPSGYTVSVDDKDHGNIIITNSHTPKEITRPKTGDANRFIAYLAVMLISAAAVIGLLVSRRRIRN
ncbi:Cna B-type domain-containing protein [Mogibacterium timidum]|uniref:Putative collagen adhesin n=2 Tax=Mogibacterium TaxID=86331 RepID=X8J9Q7_9FIRM|nr:Cna B-type domain-containing protein [Mogibacterium timidum]EUC57966.1 putative collagen adhesin [Mogibacterium timidum ATCC 33093]